MAEAATAFFVLHRPAFKNAGCDAGLSRRVWKATVMILRSGDRMTKIRMAGSLAFVLALALAGCQTGPTGELATIEVAQGSSENISSLTSVIDRNPSDPEAYNVRGTAYGRGGRYREAMADFNKALELRPTFYQAYANRALIERFLGDQTAALDLRGQTSRANPVIFYLARKMKPNRERRSCRFWSRH